MSKQVLISDDCWDKFIFPQLTELQKMHIEAGTGILRIDSMKMVEHTVEVRVVADGRGKSEVKNG